MPDEKTKHKYPVHAIFVDTKRDYSEYEGSENCKSEIWQQFICAKLLIARLLPKINYSTSSKKKLLAMKAVNLLPEGLIDFLFNQVKLFNTKNCKNVANLFHRGSYKSNIIPVRWLGNPRYVSFENIELPVPENVEKYLESRFGNNYLELPPKHLRKVSPHVKFYDLENDYAKYSWFFCLIRFDAKIKQQ